MLELAGPLAVAALVLAAGGAFKLRDPEPTRSMFTEIGVRSPRLATMLAVGSGVAELALGTATFLVGGRVLGLLTAAAFVVFTLLAARLVRLPTTASCGCFGRHSGDTTWLHVGVDAAVAAVALTAAVLDAPGFLDARGDLPGAGIAFVGMAAIGAWLVIATMTVLPDALVASRRGPQPATVRAFEISRTR
jgi:hypothetical protein